MNVNCFRLGIAILVVALNAPAQYTTASLSGTVTDSTGAVLPEAKITARNVDTGFTQTVTSDASGAFLFAQLPVGNYELRA